MIRTGTCIYSGVSNSIILGLDQGSALVPLVNLLSWQTSAEPGAPILCVSLSDFENCGWEYSAIGMAPRYVILGGS